jgi:hypothetical protein
VSQIVSEFTLEKHSPGKFAATKFILLITVLRKFLLNKYFKKGLRFSPCALPEIVILHLYVQNELK